MTRSDLSKYLSDKTMITKNDCDIIVDVVIEGIKKAIVEDGIIKLRGLGTIKRILREPRVARNPINEERVQVPARSYLRFIPSLKFKKEIKKIGV